MTDREIMQQALDALENSVDLVRHEYSIDWRHGLSTRKAQLEGMKAGLDAHDAAITALRERLAQPFAMQVRPAEFVQIIKSKETLTGIPSYWAEWPNREQP